MTMAMENELELMKKQTVGRSGNNTTTSYDGNNRGGRWTPCSYIQIAIDPYGNGADSNTIGATSNLLNQVKAWVPDDLKDAVQ